MHMAVTGKKKKNSLKTSWNKSLSIQKCEHAI